MRFDEFRLLQMPVSTTNTNPHRNSNSELISNVFHKINKDTPVYLR